MAPTIMVPVLKRKRVTQNHGAPANKKTGTPRSEDGNIASNAYVFHQEVTYPGVGVVTPDVGVGVGSAVSGALAKMEDMSSGDERTDDESESYSSDTGGGRASNPPPCDASQGAIAIGSVPVHMQVPQVDSLAQRHAMGVAAGFGMPVAPLYGIPRAVQREGRLEVDEWGWFVDAAEDELRMMSTSR